MSLSAFYYFVKFKNPAKIDGDKKFKNRTEFPVTTTGRAIFEKHAAELV